MSKGVDALISPRVLKWARESTAFSPEEAARLAGIKNPAKLIEAENGERHITFRQLRALAKAFRLPLRVMYLPEPPDEGELPVDFRSADDQDARSPALIRAVRVARERRNILLDLLDEQGVRSPLLPAPRTDEGIIDVITPLFCFPGSALAERVPSTGAASLSATKQIVESELPLVVFETRGSLGRIRGCSIYDERLSVIILNSQDSPNARRFTLAHEVAHILMRVSGICDPFSADGDIEQRCNIIAGEAMMPTRLLADRLALPGRAEDKIASLSRDFRMSNSAVAVRLNQAGAISRQRLGELLDFFQQQFVASREVQSESEGGPSHHLMQALRLGPKFTNAVLDGYADGDLSTTQTAELLGVTPSHVSIAGVQEKARLAYDR